MTTAGHPLTPCRTARWPTPRILFTLSGTVTLLSVALAAATSHWWLLVTAAVGLNQLLYVAVGACPASVLIDRLRTRTTLTDPAEEDTCSSTTTR